MIHTYSLVHDDLPAMDDDDLRRGQPTSHKVWGEGLAILVGDALLTEAFRVMAGAPGVPPARTLGAVAEVAAAAGEAGMVGGQALDLAAEGSRPSLRRVQDIHRRKTGALHRSARSRRTWSRGRRRPAPRGAKLRATGAARELIWGARRRPRGRMTGARQSRASIGRAPSALRATGGARAHRPPARRARARREPRARPAPRHG